MCAQGDELRKTGELGLLTWDAVGPWGVPGEEKGMFTAHLAETLSVLQKHTLPQYASGTKL